MPVSILYCHTKVSFWQKEEAKIEYSQTVCVYAHVCACVVVMVEYNQMHLH